MGITQWLAVAMIFVVIYGLIKRYETRLVLIGSALPHFLGSDRRP